MTRARLQTVYAGLQAIVFTDTIGEPLPIASTRRAWRDVVYRPPVTDKPARFAQRLVRRAARRAFMTERFNVVQFFVDETYEYVRRGVDAKEAVDAARHYCSSVGAQLGTTRRVIITDSGDETTFEWQFGKGVVFPPEHAGKQPKVSP